MAALYSCSLASVGIRLFSLIRTSILWLAFLHSLLIWWLIFSLLSIVTPIRFSVFIDSISLPWILMVGFFLSFALHYHRFVFTMVTLEHVVFIPFRCFCCIPVKWWPYVCEILSCVVNLMVICIHRKFELISKARSFWNSDVPKKWS